MTTASHAQIVASNWNPALTGSQSWQVDANWDTDEFPDDPGRMDINEEAIADVIGANVSVALGGDLNLNVGASDVTVAALWMGGTAGPVTTTISASAGGRLAFENYEMNDTVPSTDPEVPDDVIPSYNFGRGLIVSGGVAGSTNVISAPLFINRESVDVGSYTDRITGEERVTTNDLLITGPIQYAGDDFTSSLSMEAFGRTLTIDSDLVVNDTFTAATNNPVDFAINQSTASQGTVVINGDISGTGFLQIGPQNGSSGLAPSTVILNGALTTDGGVTQGRVNLVLANDNALGTTGTVKQAISTRGSGANLISTSDDRVISAPIQLSQYVTIKGEHSLTWAGDVAQTNARGWINLLPEGKTFYLSGTQAADDQTPADTNPIPGGDNVYNFDGTGKTVVTGALIDHSGGEEGEVIDVSRSYSKRGTGAVYLQGSVQAEPNLSTYRGYTYISGGNLHAATLADFGATTSIRSSGGAIGLENGSVTGPDATAFLGKLNSRAQLPNSGASGASSNDVVGENSYDSGGLMLSAAEASANLNFTTGPLANAADMSVAGPEQGLTYTGTVTPAASTYRFGGGAGVITLPNNNQLTGANSLVVMNGHDLRERQGLGGVKITGTNNYTGATTIQGRSLDSNQDAAANNGGVGSSSAVNEFNGSTLIATTLANGGVASSIGASTNDAANLHIQGGTLRYEGGAASTDRLFTVGTRGATIDSSGTGPLVFTNTGALTIDTAQDRQGIVYGFGFGFMTGVTPSSETVAYDLPDTSDLVPGMQISGGDLADGSDDDEVVTITAVRGPSRVEFSDPINLFGGSPTPTTLSFIDAERTFTLSGDNTGDNVLRPVIGDSATNIVNLTKSGLGKWILEGANTYTGDTLVEDGVLSITNAYLADDADVMVESGAVFDLDFSGTDTIGALFLSGASKTTGTYGAIGSGADFESAFFTGSGLLGVTAVVDSGVIGDYNNDGVVNAADYTVWRDNEGAADGTLPNDAIGGTVAGVHYDQWRDNYGSTEVAEATFSTSVPEPGAALLAAIALAGFVSRRGRA